jgi:putative endonuclease
MKVVNPIGKLGEDIATDYLKTNHYTIVERNFHAKGGEIDIIAIEKTETPPVLCFIEVKTRTSFQFGTPFEAITPWKLHFIEKTAIYYTILHKNLPKSLRLDAISVLLDKNNTVKAVEHLKNIGM